ncbi:hypothetical protein [Noviherbaspirillum sp.]|uniref:hypothetical protein n=1 Tax=Noviherbaspirillum sp. TaxID=1926288 RepID=UPI002FE3D4D4
MRNEQSLPKHPIHPNPENVKDGDGKLERIAKVIDPPGNEVDGQDLNDPGRMTPGAPPVDNRS